MLMKFRVLIVILALAGFGASSLAADCQDGTPHPDKCFAELKSLEKRLQDLHEKQRQRLVFLYSGDHGGSEPDAYAKEAVAAFNREAAAWKKYREAKCRYESLRDGMSVQYADSVTAACEVEETQARIKDLRKCHK